MFKIDNDTRLLKHNVLQRVSELAYQGKLCDDTIQEIPFEQAKQTVLEALGVLGSDYVAMLREGKSIEQPTYSYLTCSRLPETIHIEPRNVIIIEGILALCDKKLRNMMDLKVFVDADPDERLIRVIQRDVVERGRTAEAVMERYTRVLKPMHQQFIEPCKRYADLIVPEGGNNQVAIDILTMYIKRHIHDND